MSEPRAGQIWKERGRGRGARSGRYVRIVRDNPAASAYVTVQSVVSFGGGPWLTKYGSRVTEILYSRFKIDFTLCQDVVPEDVPA